MSGGCGYGGWELVLGEGISKGSLCQLLVQVVTCEVLEVGLLDVAVLGPDDLATVVHTHGRLFSTKLEMEGREGRKEGIEGGRKGRTEGGREGGVYINSTATLGKGN